MLVNLAFVMQRSKKYLRKIFVTINKDGGEDNFWILWGDTAVIRGDIELMGVPPVPPLGKTLGQKLQGAKPPEAHRLLQFWYI